MSLLAPIRAESPDAQITSDASGSWGCGAFFEEKWFQLQWDHSSSPHHITIKELLPIVVGAAVWGREWSGKTIRARCDNMAAVHILRSRRSKDPEAMHLVRCLCLIECTFNFTLVSQHLPGRHNGLADALSRDNLSYFLSNYPQAQAGPTMIPPQVYETLISRKPDWTSRAWATLFGTTLSRV